MLKLMGRIYLQFYAEMFCLSKPVIVLWESFSHNWEKIIVLDIKRKIYKSMYKANLLLEIKG